MRVFLLTLLTMVAFAANSVLTRVALSDPAMGPASFAAIRLLAGAVMLTALVLLQGRQPKASARTIGPLSLALYALAFSFAYVTLKTGIGALILFGGVQITMFAGAVWARERIPARRWIGATLAFVGLMVLVAPGRAAPNLVGALLMAASAMGWGIYSLVGRREPIALDASAANFLYALPIGLILCALTGNALSVKGTVLALISGAITSGLGYALWYTVLPKLDASVAAVAQLSVPVLAALGGVVTLGEPVTLRMAMAASLILGGIGVSVLRSTPTAARGSETG